MGLNMSAIRTHVVQQSAMITTVAVGLLGSMSWYLMCSTAQTRLAMQAAWTPTKTLSQHKMSLCGIDLAILSLYSVISELKVQVWTDGWCVLDKYGVRCGLGQGVRDNGG